MQINENGSVGVDNSAVIEVLQETIGSLNVENAKLRVALTETIKRCNELVGEKAILTEEKRHLEEEKSILASVIEAPPTQEGSGA